MYKATRTLNAICTNAWAISEEALDIIVRVAMRENDDLEAVEARLGRKLDNTRAVTVREGVATIPVNGPIFRYANLFTMISGGTTIDALAQDFTQAINDPAIKAIVLYIDSPGGQVSGVNEFANMVHAARGQKPIVAYVSNHGTSAAYWIATAADSIVMDATAMVGSIGVLQVYRGASGTGKEITFISSQSPRKTPNPETEGGRAQIQSEIDATADVFVSIVARNRDVSIDTVLDDFGQGGILVGQHAVDVGMADRIGSYESVLFELAASPQVRPLATRSRGALGMSDEKDVQASLSAETTALQAQLAEMRQMLATERTNRIKTEAAAYVEGQVRDSRLLPAEASHYTTLYAQLAQDDLNAPLAEGSRVDLLRGAFAARPQHGKADESLSAESHILEPHKKQSPVSAELDAADKSARDYATRMNGVKR